LLRRHLVDSGGEPRTGLPPKPIRSRALAAHSPAPSHLPWAGRAVAPPGRTPVLAPSPVPRRSRLESLPLCRAPSCPRCSCAGRIITAQDGCGNPPRAGPRKGDVPPSLIPWLNDPTARVIARPPRGRSLLDQLQRASDEPHAMRRPSRQGVAWHRHPPKWWIDGDQRALSNCRMRVVPPITVKVAPAGRQWPVHRKMRAPSRLPSVLPTHSSFLRRVLSTLGLER
jgi:hypothetical protein